MPLKRIATVLLLLAWYIFFLARPIFLTPADIGRHITNGKILLSTSITQWGPILHTNFYSYTFPDAPFINHHWGGGIIFFLVWSVAGFVGLSVLGFILHSVAFLLSFDLAKRAVGWRLASLLAFVTIPLLADRAEVRPELFSYIFVLLYLWILTAVRDGRLRARALWILPLIQLLWVNIHIYFFLGFVVIGAFWIESLIQKNNRLRPSHLVKVGVAIIVAACLNPSFLKGFFYPFTIFNNYGLAVSENKSVPVFLNLHPTDSAVIIFLLLAASLLGFGLYCFIKHRRAFPVALAVISGVLFILAWLLIRNLALFAFVALPTVGYCAAPWATRVLANKRGFLMWLAGVATLLVILLYPRIRTLAGTRGIGLLPGNGDAAAFINAHKISGPLFNDFDSGSYVIFYLYPRVKPFVDNRAEAYPAAFFKNTYVPMHMDNKVWLEEDAIHKFNTILYSFDDKAPYALPFIVARILDPAWAPVYTDKFSIVFLKRNEQNATLIKQFEIPKDKFSLHEE